MWGKASSWLWVSVLAGCGGGGGGYGSGSMMLAPTVSFSMPAAATTINFGQAVTVAWTTAYATSCTATTSSAAGGAFNGSEMLSGSHAQPFERAGAGHRHRDCDGRLDRGSD